MKLDVANKASTGITTTRCHDPLSRLVDDRGNFCIHLSNDLQKSIFFPYHLLILSVSNAAYRVWNARTNTTKYIGIGLASLFDLNTCADLSLCFIESR